MSLSRRIRPLLGWPRRQATAQEDNPSVSADQRRVLQQIWRCYVPNGAWPTFAQLDRQVDRELHLDCEDLLRGLPPGLVFGVWSGASLHVTDPTPVGLTVAGILETGEGQRELELTATVIAHAVDLEREWNHREDSADARPELSSAAIAAYLHIGEELLARVGGILRHAQWGWSSGTGSAGPEWSFTVNREVRRFRHKSNRDIYIELGKEARDLAAGYARRAVLEPVTLPRDGSNAWSDTIGLVGSAFAALGVIPSGIQAGWAGGRIALLSFGVLGLGSAFVIWRRRSEPGWILVAALVGSATLIAAGTFVTK